MPFPSFPNLISQFNSAGLAAAYRWFSYDFPNYMSKLFAGDDTIILQEFADTDAPNKRLYWSLTASKAAIKDSGGVSHYLW